MSGDVYFRAFGMDPKRILRGNLLTDILGIRLNDVPRFRDAWVERGQNPDKAPGVGPLIIALYTESNGHHRDGMASKIFTMRAHPMYREERDDWIMPTFTTFYFNVPAEASAETINAMAHAAVEPVNTDRRWAEALGRSPVRSNS